MAGYYNIKNTLRYLSAYPYTFSSVPKNIRLYSTIIDPPGREGSIPDYQRKSDESLEVKRARLLYQSRKRGILENDLILSTFAQRYLGSMDTGSLEAYDKLLNDSGNEWNIYYWVTGAKPVPQEFNTTVMTLLQQHTRNEEREQRFRQPDLASPPS